MTTWRTIGGAEHDHEVSRQGALQVKSLCTEDVLQLLCDSLPISKAVTVCGVYSQRVAGSILRSAGCLGLLERLAGSCMLARRHEAFLENRSRLSRQQFKLPDSIF